MRSVRLTLQHGPETVHPMHRFVADHDDFERYRLVHWRFGDDDRSVLLFHVVGDRDAYEAALADVRDSTDAGEIVAADVGETGTTDVREPGAGDREADRFYVYVRERRSATGAGLVAAFSRASLVGIPPLEYRDDWSVRLGVVGEAADLRRAIETVPDGIAVEVERVGEYDPDPTVAALTPRQREAVRVARELGYFAVPREAGVRDVADVLDCSPGTAAEHLRKAQSSVMGELDL